MCDVRERRQRAQVRGRRGEEAAHELLEDRVDGEGGELAAHLNGGVERERVEEVHDDEEHVVREG